MKYLLDTNICVFVIRRKSTAVVRRLAQHAADEIGISAVTLSLAIQVQEMRSIEMVGTQQAGRRTKHPYVTQKKEVCGGKPVIAGTRIKVEQIVVEYERLGWSPDEVIQAHPHLTLAQIHDALSYYYENAAEINAALRDGESFVWQLQAARARTPDIA